MVPVAAALLPQWLVDADWRKRHASLICLAQIAEGCQKVGQEMSRWWAHVDLICNMGSQRGVSTVEVLGMG